MRARFIDVVNAVVDGAPGIVRYLHGTYQDNGIDLTPLEHMGNRAMAFERRGLETEIGSRNAARIFADEAAACEARARKDEAALAGENALVRAVVAQDVRALEALDRYERLQRRLIRRRLQAELAEIIIAKARSRADAVIHTLTPMPGHRVKFRDGDADLLADARQQVAWVERNSPSPAEREVERRILAQLEHRAAREWSIIVSATSRTARSGRVGTSAPIRYQPCDRSRIAAAPRASRYDPQRRQRLLLWLRKHRGDADLLIFADGEVLLGKRVPPAIDTLMRQFAEEPSFQRLLLAERRRREAGVVAQLPSPGGRLEAQGSSSVAMIPIDQWEWPARAKLNETAQDAAALADEPELDTATKAVTDTDSVAALRLSHAIAAREEDKASRAARMINDALAKKKLAAEKRDEAATSAGGFVPDGADPAERISDLRAFGVGDRPPETEGVLPVDRDPPPAHLTMRDASVSRVDGAPVSPPESIPAVSTQKRGLLGQAADVLRGNAAEARSKGRSADHIFPAVPRGKDGHDR